eukprot:CAMPEP_0170197730 /NCGR_PEP_ID=MMETSP0040_2-20121228/67071_1 /TAXON_ID=641309 /ORGANISM="Lotharella oceanica, Strain CCMP622" /LENGTH=214 /DNA_ID=CAMNT_0010447469 /DNA_START=78 /DNA_END=722 /DNA_ORIENTATION=-
MSEQNENLPPQAMMKLMKDIRDVTKNTPEGIVIHFSEENMACIHADIEGPVGTPFEGGLFRCMLRIGSDFPNSPPKGYFITKIFHPNVSSKGEICVNTLKKDWNPSHGLKHVLMVIRCLLIHPNPESALNEEAGKLLLEEYDSYSKRAAMFTKLYATPKNAEAKESKSVLPSNKVDPKRKGTEKSQSKGKSSKSSKSSKAKSKRRAKGTSLKRL